MPIDLEEKTSEQEIDQDQETKGQDEAFEEIIEDEESKKKEKEEVQDEITKKKVEKGENSKRIPKWKLAKELRDKKGLDVECDEWGIPKTLVHPPNPKRYVKQHLADKFAKFLEIFKKIHINIPFSDASK
ncbi:hypothetical protein ACS0TY_021837 [Phlomoides rotata]